MKKLNNTVLDIETSGLDYVTNNIIGNGVCSDPKAKTATYTLWTDKEKARVRAHLLKDNCIGHNFKFDCHFYFREGLPIPEHFEDTMLMSYVINENVKHGLEPLCIDHLGIEPWKHLVKEYCQENSIDIEESGYSKIPFEILSKYGKLDVINTMKLYNKLKQIIKHEQLTEVYNRECRLARCLIEIEDRGVPIDKELLCKIGKKLHKQELALEKAIYKAAKRKFNIKSNDELGQFLFNPKDGKALDKDATNNARCKGYGSEEVYKTVPKGLGLDVLETTANGKPKCDEYTLSKVHHPIIPKLIEYRLVTKLQSTYCQPLIDGALSDGILRCHFNQEGARTGRFSSTNPNLQNVPNGHDIRKAFVCRPDYYFFFFDYSGMEMAVYNNFAKDPTMTKAFLDKANIHDRLTQVYYGRPKFTEAERDLIKTLTFGILYGMGARGLARKFNKPMNEAYTIINRYRATFPVMKSYNDSIAEKIKSDGFIQNPFGRRRRLEPDAAYKGVNALVQGTCSDIMKEDIIRVHPMLQPLKSNILLTIHDELAIEIHKTELHLVEKIKDMMEDFSFMEIPLVVDVEYSKTSWGDKHEWKGKIQ